MSLARIKKGDEVIVLTGKERGKKGTVREVMPKKGTALVQDINISKRHMKPTGTARQAGIVDKEQPIHLSNLALVDPKSSKPTRVRARTLTNGRKVRIAIASGEQMARE
jgi:large subunit ribosomal protein L24